MKVSASKLDRLAICPASGALPQVHGTTSPAADRGTALHEYLANVNLHGREEALARVQEEYRAGAEVIDLERLPICDPGSYAVEVALALDPDTGTARELGRGLGRKYDGRRDGEIVGTADVLALTADGRGVFVADWKTGRTPVPPARVNRQLRFLALAACRAFGRDEATVAVVHLREDGTAWFDRAELDVFELDATLMDVRHIGARVIAAWSEIGQGFTPSVTVSEHCRFCPAFNACPAQVGLVKYLGATPAAAETDVRRELASERASEAYRRFRLIQDAMKRAGEQLHAYAMLHGIDLGDGVVYGPVESRKEYVDGAVVREVLRDMFGPEIADLACSWDSSKAAIKEALRKVIQDKGGKLAPLERETIERIRSAGGVAEKVSVTVKEHRPAKKNREAA